MSVYCSGPDIGMSYYTTHVDILYIIAVIHRLVYFPSPSLVSRGVDISEAGQQHLRQQSSVWEGFIAAVMKVVVN